MKEFNFHINFHQRILKVPNKSFSKKIIKDSCSITSGVKKARVICDKEV